MNIIFNISRHHGEFSVALVGGRVEMDGERVVKKTDRRQLQLQDKDDEIRVSF